MPNICFFTQNITFQIPYPNLIRPWIKHCIQASDKKLVHLNYIFCSDTHLHKLNKTYLEHDYFTDVITFNHSNSTKEIEGDAYISIDRVKEHTRTFGATFYHELCRVLIHAVLHLIGYDDTTPEEQCQMRNQENLWLAKPLLQQYLNSLL